MNVGAGARFGRAVVVLLAAVALSACAPNFATIERERAAFYREPGRASGIDRLTYPGEPSRVVAMCWEVGKSVPRLVAGLADGRLAVFRPDLGREALATVATEQPIAAVLPIGENEVIAAGPAGLSAWDVRGPDTQSLAAIFLGPSTCLLADPEEPDEFLAGMADGRVLRIRWRAGSESPLAVEQESDIPGHIGAIRRLSWSHDRKKLIVESTDDGVWFLDLALRPLDRSREPGKSIVDLGASHGVASIRPGPGLGWKSADGESEVGWGLARCGDTLHSLGLGGWILVSGDDRLVLWPGDESGLASPALARRIEGLRGPTLVAVDPGRRIALANADGPIEVLDLSILVDRGMPLDLAEVPELAMRPERRFHRDADAEFTRSLDLSDALRKRLDGAIHLLDRGHAADALGALQSLRDDPALDRGAVAEITAAIAAARQLLGAGPAEVLAELGSAIESLALLGRRDRERELRTWRIDLNLRAGEASSQATEPIESTLDELSRVGQGVVGRERLLIEIRRASALLRRGEPTEAARVFRAVFPEAQADPVLDRVAAIDELRQSIDGRLDHAGGAADRLAATSLAAAEDAERLGHIDDAERRYTAWLRTVERQAEPPTAGLIDRGYRGLARIQLARGREAAVIGTLERAAWSRWVDRHGEGVARTSPVYLPPSANARAAELARARLEAIGRRPPSDESPWERVRALETALTPDSLARPAIETETPFDPTTLRLGPDEAVLAFRQIAPEVLVGIVFRGRERPRVRTIAAGLPAIRKAIWSWRRRLGDGGRSLDQSDFSTANGIMPAAEPAPTISRNVPPKGTTWAAHLDDLLITPFLPSLDGVRTLIVVPDDALAAMPFGEIGRDRPWRDRLEIRFAPSLALVRPAAIRPESARNDHSFWRGAGIDPECGDASYRERGWAVSTAEAPGPDFDALTAAEVIQLGGPSHLDARRSDSGDVEMSLDPGEPWPAHRVLMLAISARVVVFTPSPEPIEVSNIRGEGIRDLAQAWLSAGARSVVVGLWAPPEDSARVFLAEFHRALAEGATASQALGLARDEVAQRPEFGDPVHWAGYVLYGAP